MDCNCTLKMDQDTIGKGRHDMTVNGSRQFKGNDGRSYLVKNACSADRHNGKYNLTVKVNGAYKLCYDMFCRLMFFDTIKDAQREVLYHAEFIRVMTV